MTPIEKQLVKAIETCGKSRYRLSAESGIDAAALCRFVAGQRGLNLKTAIRLANALNLELCLKPRTRS